MLPSSNFQVASSEVNRLPTLKELIGYQTNEYASSPSPIFLSLFPLKAKDEEILSHEKNTNRILEGTSVRNDTIFNAEPTTLMPNKHDQKEETGYAIQNDLDLSVDSIDTYYVEDNIDENDISLTNKKRIDRQDSSTTVTLKPTTMRGIPLVDLMQSQVPRGFYVTRSETENPIPEQVKNDESTTEWTTLSIESKENVSSKIANEIEQPNAGRTIVTDFNHNDSEENSKSSTQVITTLKPDFFTKSNEVKDRDESIAPSTNRVQTEKDIDLFTEIPSLETNAAPSISIPVISPTDSPVTFTSLSSNEPESIVSTTSESLTNDDATLSIKNTDSTSTSVTEVQSNFTTKTNILESVTETGLLYIENGTHAAHLQENYSTDEKVSSSQQTGEVRRNVVKDGEESKLSSSLSTTTRPSTQSERSANKFNRRRQRIEFNPNYEFGRKSQDGRQDHRYVSPSNEDQKDSIKETRRTQHPRRRVISYRGRHRRPFVTGTAVNDSLASNTTTRTTNRTVNDDDKLKVTKKSAKEESEQIEAITGSTKRTKAGNSVENRNDGENANKEETSVEKKVVPKANLTGKEAVSKEERLRIEENIGRSESEVSLDFKFPTLATCDDIKKEV